MSKWSYIELDRAITCTFMHGFQNNFAQLLSSRRRTFFSGRLKVTSKGSNEGQNGHKLSLPGHNWYIYAWISN